MAREVQEEARFWKDRFIKLAWIANQAIRSIPKSLRVAEEMKCALDTRKVKQSAHQHKYATRLKSKVMESKVEALEQQNQDLRGEVGQLREQMAQMFQILT
ncbi:hypothetical protein CR513_03717, partial [Mucuna pruriens]